MGTFLFGMARRAISAGYGYFSVQIARIRCSLCPSGKETEYIAWGDRNASDADKQEAAALLTQLVERDHPEHRVDRYEGMTLEDLRLRSR
jgi:hypothetical protein